MTLLESAEAVQDSVEAVQQPPNEKSSDEPDPLGDPWNLARLALGSLAGEHWRVKQAVVWPTEAFRLRDLPEGSTWWEEYQRTQTYDAFRRAIPFRPNCTNISAELVVIGSLDALEKVVDLNVICAHLEVFLGLRLSRRSTPLKVGPWAQLRRAEGGGHEQVSAEAVLGALGSSVDIRSTCTLAITSKDLYPAKKNYEFVIGLADVTHRVGVYSTARYFGLGPESPTTRSGQDASRREELTLIMIKVLCREGLKLCGASECCLLKCLMNPISPGKPEQAVAGNPLELCCVCMRKLHWITQADPLDRLAKLPSVMSNTFFEESTRSWDRMRQIGLPTYASFSDPDPLNKRAARRF